MADNVVKQDGLIQSKLEWRVLTKSTEEKNFEFLDLTLWLSRQSLPEIFSGIPVDKDLYNLPIKSKEVQKENMVILIVFLPNLE